MKQLTHTLETLLKAHDSTEYVSDQAFARMDEAVTITITHTRALKAEIAEARAVLASIQRLAKVTNDALHPIAAVCAINKIVNMLKEEAKP